MQPKSVVDLASRSLSATANAMYKNVLYFDAISLKMKLILSECKRLGLHSRLHHFDSFFQKNFWGRPPESPPTGGEAH